MPSILIGEFVYEGSVELELALHEGQQGGIARGIGIIFEKYLLAMAIDGGQVDVVKEIGAESQLVFASQLQPAWLEIPIPKSF
jgi:hypothetical protein